MFFSELFSSIVQVILFSAIPFIWWLITSRKKESFFTWIGLKKSKGIDFWKLAILIIAMVAVFWIIDDISLQSMQNTETATSVFSGKGVKAVPAIVVYAFFHTALSEEILFRGFLLKRLITKLPFAVANIIQAFCFGLIHGLEFLGEVNISGAILLVLVIGSASYAEGYINEKKAGGSIFPSWIIHGITNLLSGLIAAF